MTNVNLEALNKLDIEKRIESLVEMDEKALGHLLLAAKGHKVRYSDGLRTGETNIWYPTFGGMDYNNWCPAVAGGKGRDQAMQLMEEYDLYVSNDTPEDGKRSWFVSAPPHINNIVEHNELQVAIVIACILAQLAKPKEVSAASKDDKLSA